MATGNRFASKHLFIKRDFFVYKHLSQNTTKILCFSILDDKSMQAMQIPIFSTQSSSEIMHSRVVSAFS